MKKGFNTSKRRLYLFVVVIFCTTNIFASFKPQKITLNFDSVPLERVFKEVSKQSNLNFAYSSDLVDTKRVVSIKMRNTEVETVLKTLFENTDITYKILNDKIFLSGKEKVDSKAQQKARTIKGRVLDENGEPIVGANIWVKETTNGVITDVDGYYTISYSSQGGVLVISFLGYKQIEEPINNRTEINFKMEPSTESLDEVVVVGYGSQRKESIVGSISTVSMNDLKLPVAKLSTSLAGQLAGVVAVSRSGEPGEAGDFYIRGISSFNAASQKPLVLVDGIERSLDSVDPEDIETFSILKDATATAVYGVRGANGVMLITTRKGKEGKPLISARAEFGVVSPTQLPKMVNSVQFAEMVNEVRPNTYSPETIEKYMTATGLERNLYPNVDWLGELFSDVATNQKVSLSVSGGGTIARYFISGSFYNEGSIYKTDASNDYNTSINYKRYNFRTNVDVNVTSSTVLDVSLSNLYEVKNSPAASRDDSYTGIWTLAFKTSPNAYPAYYMNEDGSFDRLAGQLANQGWNPYNQLIHSGYSQHFYNSAQANIGVTQDLGNLITPGLKANIRFAWDAYNNTSITRTKTPQTWLATGNYNPDGSLDYYETQRGSETLAYSQGGSGSRSIYLEASVTYDRIFNEKHRIGALFLYNQREKTILWAGSSRAAMPYKTQGIAGRITYAYDDKYFVEGNFGYNGSENFSPGNRFGIFPSVALGWMVSNESFWEPIRPYVDMLKIRGSYGLVGNDQIGGNRRFIYEGTILTGVGGQNFGDQGQSGGSGVREGDIANPNVGWETAHKTNIGAEFVLFESLKIQADYFKENRTGIFVQRASLPGIAGNTSIPWSNVGEMKNQGFDSSLEYGRKVGNCYLSGRANFTYNNSLVINNDEPAYKWPYQGASGHKYGQEWGLICEGFFESEEEIRNSAIQQFGEVRPGDFKYSDINGDGIVNDEDQVPIGNPGLPQISYGFGGSLSWNSFDFSFFFQGVAKTSIFARGNALYGITSSDIKANGMFEDLYLRRWQEGRDNTDAVYPRLSDGANTNNQQKSTARMYDGSYMRLKNVEIGYTLPKEWLKKIYSRNLRIYVSAVNLLTFSKFDLWDPELGSGQGMGYPPNRIFNVGLNISF